jgi:hypothetical protein
MGLEEAANGLIPPDEDGKPLDRRLLWRLTVSGFVGFLAVAFLWSVGVFAGMGYPGFARAGEIDDVKKQVQNVQTQISNVQAELLAKEIDSVSAALCMEQYEPRLLDYRNVLQEKYHAAKGEYHQSPPCEVLLKLKH